MTASALYPGTLDHLEVTTPDPARLADYYKNVLGGEVRDLGKGRRLLTGDKRRLLFAEGPANKLGFSGFSLGSVARVDALRQSLKAKSVDILTPPASLFGNEAFAVADPDGNKIVFGAGSVDGAPTAAGAALPGRLQHVVVATTDLPQMLSFYTDKLGFLLSDRVKDAQDNITAAFFRSDDEHHSFACFRAPAAKLDHFCFETTCWNDIRDWADHISAQHLSLDWGPGRHGPGDNLFFMLNDPDGNAYEFSAELERMPPETETRDWPHEPRTLNYWGVAWMRS
jgi:catechol 2,3-dioxygenase